MGSTAEGGKAETALLPATTSFAQFLVSLLKEGIEEATQFINLTPGELELEFILQKFLS